MAERQDGYIVEHLIISTEETKTAQARQRNGKISEVHRCTCTGSTKDKGSPDGGSQWRQSHLDPPTSAKKLSRTSETDSERSKEETMGKNTTYAQP